MIARNDFLSIYGLYLFDPSIFDLFLVPSGMNKDDVVDNLVIELAELEVLYPDPNFMKKAIGAWSRKQLPAWEKLFATEHFDYNPIWNKDGVIVEEFEEERENSNSSSRSGNNVTSTNGGSESLVSAYNENGYHPSDKTIVGNEDNNVYAEDAKGSGNEKVSHKNTRTETGNIGVTTTQKMIEEEREVDKFLTTNYIINEFKNRFCLLIY